jgi:hypothetical protein
LEETTVPLSTLTKEEKARRRIVNFDAEVVWGGFDQGNLLSGLTGSSEEEIGAFDAKMPKSP